MRTYVFKVMSTRIPRVMVRANNLEQADAIARGELDELYASNGWEAPVRWTITLLSVEADDLSGDSEEQEEQANRIC